MLPHFINQPCSFSPLALSANCSKHNQSNDTFMHSSRIYERNKWTHDYVESLQSEVKENTYSRDTDKLKERIRGTLFCESVGIYTKLVVIDDLHRLGLGYYFDKEIKRSLDIIFTCENAHNEDNLQSISLYFRLLRQHGYKVSQDIFKRFMNEDGSFRIELCEDVKGLLDLYKASHMCLEGENILHEAKDFTLKHLKLLGEHIDPNLVEEVNRALDLPLHWRMPRLEARHYIEVYQRKESMDPILLELANVDFNALQATHQKELRNMSRWWKDLGLSNKLGPTTYQSNGKELGRTPWQPRFKPGQLQKGREAVIFLQSLTNKENGRGCLASGLEPVQVFDQQHLIGLESENKKGPRPCLGGVAHLKAYCLQKKKKKKKLGTRDRLVESFLWSVGLTSRPQDRCCREWLTKVVSLILNQYVGNSLRNSVQNSTQNLHVHLVKITTVTITIDDIYDIIGSVDELDAFTSAVEKWDLEVVDLLPDYMRICFLALFNTTNDIVYEKYKEHELKSFSSLQWLDMCKAMLVEARWSKIGYTPSLAEYLENAWVSVALTVGLVHAFFATNQTVKNSVLQSLDNNPDFIYYSAMIFRLCNDLATSSAELERGDVSSAIQCYVKEANTSEKIARDKIKSLISEMWKKLNESIYDSIFEDSFVTMAINNARTAHSIYQYGDGISVQDHEARKRVARLLIEPITVKSK
ncbi:hypothetical protein ACHQM5_003796 [Ranunculus cassubicifolius]